MTIDQIQQLDAMRAAAASFAAFADAWEGHKDETLILRRPGVGQITVGDFRRLRDALGPQQEE